MPNVFRWNIARREQLGRLVTGEPVEGLSSILDDVRRCAARVVAMSGDSRLVFVGRSPEALFDYLTGAFAETSWSDRLTLLHLSLRSSSERWSEMNGETRTALRQQFGVLGLDPAAIATAARPIAFVDVICDGNTFASLTELLFDWAADEGIGANALRRRVRIVGIITRGNCGYTTTGWQRQAWARRYRASALKGVPVSESFWAFLGNSDAKVARSNPPSRWCDPEMARPPRGPRHTEALDLALALHKAGRSRTERDALAAAIAEQPSMRHVWCRALASELRAASRPKRVERLFGSKQRVRSWRRHVRVHR
jgi:hypothetical protein